MIILHGKGVSPGISIGNLYLFEKQQHQIKRFKIEDTKSEIERFENSKVEAINQLQELYEIALHEVGETNAQIFQIHQMMLEDLDYCDSITNMITLQEINAEYAVATTGDNFSKMFSVMDDEYMRGRAADVKDVSERLVKILLGGSESLISTSKQVIVAAQDLAPSETVQMDKEKVLGFVTRDGSSNSHTAILARTIGIPAIIGLGDSLKSEYDGMLCIINGHTGETIINPDAHTIKHYNDLKAKEDEKNNLLQTLKGEENITLDGQTIDIYANIGDPSDVGNVLQNDAGGIGLFRSEFLYLESNDYPTEEVQFQAYKTVAELMSGKRVIIRTLDIGADKQAKYFNMPFEENPALGYRAIRICLDKRDIFKTQLRALYRASAFGNISIMFPMIISVEEVQLIKKIIEEVKQELTADGVEYNDNVLLGVMIETPASAIISDLLAKEVDFFSIGTNDLTQYTLAIDRQNQKLEKIYDPYHIALLRMIKMVVDNAHKHDVYVGICGELGADLSLTETFLAMGVDELSVTPTSILRLRQKVRELDIKKSKDKILQLISM